MAKNYIQPGNTVTVPAPAAVTSGSVVIVGTMVGVAQSDAASGVPVDIALTGVFDLPAATGQAHTVGAALYWDAAAGNATTTDTGNTKLGVAVAAKANNGTTTRVRLNGAF